MTSIDALTNTPRFPALLGLVLLFSILNISDLRSYRTDQSDWNSNESWFSLNLSAAMDRNWTDYYWPTSLGQLASTSDGINNGDNTLTTTTRRTVSRTTGDGPTSSSSEAATTIDVISVGSNTRKHYLDAQKEAFRIMSDRAAAASSSSNRNPPWRIRNVLTYTEDDDSEAHCHTNLTTQQVVDVSKFCRSKDRSSFSYKIRRLHYNFAHDKWLSKKGDDMIGWMCAQKRLPESLGAGLKTYKSLADLPDYLLLVDDDTYINFPLMVPELESKYPQNESYAAAGCLVADRAHGFPWGGFSTIFTRTALEFFLQPLYCNFKNSTSQTDQLSPDITTMRHQDLTSHQFETLACAKIEANLVGERPVYKVGMNLADLLLSYISHWNYTSVKTWNRPEMNPGLCLHSDWIVGHWINGYYIGRQWGKSAVLDKPEDRIHPYLKSDLQLGGSKSQCTNDSDEKCTNTSHICHHVSSEKMLDLSRI